MLAIAVIEDEEGQLAAFLRDYFANVAYEDYAVHGVHPTALPHVFATKLPEMILVDSRTLVNEQVAQMILDRDIQRQSMIILVPYNLEATPPCPRAGVQALMTTIARELARMGKAPNRQRWDIPPWVLLPRSLN